MKIAIVGAHGVGKTTLCKKLHDYVGLSNKTSVIVDEKARKSPYPINDGMCYETAQWVVCAQIKEELESKAQGFEYIICDRSCFDTVLYLKRALDKRECLFGEREIRLADFAGRHLDTYDKIILIMSDFEELEADGTRSMDTDFHADMDEEFCEFFMGVASEMVPSKAIFNQGVIEDLCKTILS